MLAHTDNGQIEDSENADSELHTAVGVTNNNVYWKSRAKIEKKKRKMAEKAKNEAYETNRIRILPLKAGIPGHIKALNEGN